MKSPSSFVANLGRLRGEKLGKTPIDPDVKLPAAVRVNIDEGEKAFRRLKGNRRLHRELKTRAAVRGTVPGFITSVVEDVQDRRDKVVNALARRSHGQGGQPPMTERLRSVQIVVNRLRSEGIRFATSRNSRMNKLVREWLNERAATSPDTRKSRRKELSADAVQYILKQIKGLDE